MQTPGRLAGYQLGYYTLQGAASAVPPLCLEVAPGHRVADLCSAPGSKTGQLVLLMEDRGLVLANELKGDRIRALSANLERLGATIVAIRRGNGESVPVAEPGFDRVLADVPCSGEGTVRAPLPDRDEWIPPRERLRLHRRQLALLQRAVKLTRPGGLIVYSTCTYHPLENEAVIAAALAAGWPLALEPIELPGLPADPGVERFEEITVPAAVAERCLRLYPHRLDSWGFFVARLRRLD